MPLSYFILPIAKRPLQQAARATSKYRCLTVPLAAPVLEKLLAPASAEGVPVKTMIADVLRKFVTGRLVEKPAKASR